MSNYGSWSVKGIDDRARAVAKQAAQKKGVTLGDYINDLLLEGHSEAGPRDVEPQPTAFSDPIDPTPLDSLARRIEAVEARSTLAITGIDQSVLGLLARLDNTENTSAAIAADVERVIDELRETHEALQDKVEQIDRDDTGHQNLQAMKALEQALGKLATHVHEENSLQQEETMAIKGRIESGFSELSERVEGIEVHVQTTLSETAQRVEKAVEQAELRAEGTSRHLSERFTDVEANVATKLSKVENIDERMGAVESDVSGAINSMEGTLLRIQERLNRAESTTDAALKGLEQSFNHLDQRIETVAVHSSPERAEALRQQFEERFEGLASNLRATVDQARAQLATEIEKAAAGANPELMGRLEVAVTELKERLLTGEERSHRALDDVTEQVNRISTGLDARLLNLETGDGFNVTETVRDEVSRFTGGIEERLDQIEERDDQLLETFSQQMTDLADRLDERVTASEEVSAEAIQQVGEQVAGAVNRLQAKQDQQFETLEQQIEASTKRNDARLSKALSNVSERLTEMQHKTVNVVSPVQKAIASLAARLEDVERFNAPPGVTSKTAALPDMPEMVAEPVAPIDLPPEPEPAKLREPEIKVTEEADGLGDLDFVPGVEALQDSPADTPSETENLFVSDTDEWSPLQDEGSTVSAEATQTEDLLATGSDWDDGRDETRESDIFADDLDNPDTNLDIDDTFGETVFVQEANSEAEDVFSPAETEPLTDEALSDPVETKSADPDAVESPAEEDAEESVTSDYLSRARKAAIAAAESSEAQANQRRRRPHSGSKAARSHKKSKLATAPERPSRLPMFAAASVFALAAAGAGAYISLRGKQPAADQTFAVPQPATETAATTADAAEPETVDTASTIEDSNLQIANLAVNTATVDADLFEETSSLAPNAEADPLPVIPVAVSLRDAALRGDPIAELQFGEQLLAEEDFVKGSDFIASAASQDQPTAQYSYAKLFEKGLGVPRDLTQARQWTEKAAKGGNIKAMHDLAVFYADGEAGEQSYAAAARWFRSAADYGLIDSQFNLAVLYENGLGISPSPAEALYWYEVAAKGGDAVAPARVEALRSQMSLEEAQAIQRRANTWQAVQAIPAANGRFASLPWQSGSRDQILALQTVLTGLGYELGTPDGVSGPSTRTAIRAFQADYGLATDGQITNALIEKINEIAQPSEA